MEFIDIETLNISTELDILTRDTQRNSMLLYQHQGNFHADDSRIGNSNQNIAHQKFESLLDNAIQENTALVLSPEYSCPKSVITHIIDNEFLRPPSNKIWVLGGESLNKCDILELMGRGSDEVFIYSEDVYTNSNKNYLDPLYYIFRGAHNDVSKLIVLIQFKTRHMGGLWNSQLESNNLIEGNTIYIIKNNNQSVRIMSLICSEAMNFRQEFTPELKNCFDWNDKPFLILNPQFNPSPSHLEFIAFRKFILEEERKEIISLNWGKETVIQGQPLYNTEVNSPRSGIFFKTIELDYSPNRIISNHLKGLYFLHLNRNTFVYYLYGSADLFRVENKPVHINQGVLQQRRREGPEVVEVLYYDETTSSFIAFEAIEDGHIQFFENRGINNNFLLHTDNSIVDKERLINISTGKITGKLENKWCDVIYLNSFNLKEADECNCRMTYVEDTYVSSETIRSLNCTNLIELDQEILPDKSQYPESIKDLTHHNIILSYSQDASTYKYKYNLTNDNGEIKKATICYLGNVSVSQVKNTYDELQKLFEEGTEGKRRIVVFYKNGTDIHSKYDENAGSITNPSNDNSSIL